MVTAPSEQEDRTRLSGLLFNRKRYNILAYLFDRADEQVTIGDIITDVDVSRPYATSLINDLHALGLVEKEKKGNMYLITVNTDSAYYGSLLKLLKIDAEPLQEAAERVVDDVLDLHLVSSSDPVPDHVAAVVLFGSVARGMPRIDSDIDLLIVHDGGVTGDDRDQLRRVFAKYGERLQVSFSLTFYTVTEWERDSQRGIAFVERVTEEGHVLWGELP